MSARTPRPFPASQSVRHGLMRRAAEAGARANTLPGGE